MLSFDTFPISYWVPLYLLIWLFLWAEFTHRLKSSTVFLLALLALFLLMKLPSIVFNDEINPDESQMIAQALALHTDPIYFRSVDGTTGGPLDSYLLIIPTWFGLSFDYMTAHITAFILIALCLFITFKTVHSWFGESIARLSIVPTVLVLGITQHGDFSSYNSEMIAIVLLSLSYYIYAKVINQSRPSLRLIGLVGFWAGMVPFCKLQGVLLAIVVCAFLALDLLSRKSTLQIKLVQVGILTVTGLSFPSFVVLFTWLNNVYDDFVTFYIISNFTYAGATNLIDNLLSLPAFFASADQFIWLVLLTGVVLLTWCVTSIKYKFYNLKDWRIGGFIFALVIVTLYSVTRTGTGYIHYLYFLVSPLVFCLAYSLHGVNQLDVKVSSWLHKMVAAGAIAILVGFGAQTVSAYTSGKPINPFPSDKQIGNAMIQTPVTKAILTYAKPGEKLVVWGWRNDYYVKTQMPQGVAENHVVFSVFNHKMRSAYHNRYIADFKRSMPPVFVDAVGSQNLWLTDKKTQGHEFNVGLAKIIDQHYTYVGTINDTRMYVRNDRMPHTSQKRELKE